MFVLDESGATAYADWASRPPLAGKKGPVEHQAGRQHAPAMPFVARLTLKDIADTTVSIALDDFSEGLCDKIYKRDVPVRSINTVDGPVQVATVYDLATRTIWREPRL
jgi:hypothetical protein